MYISIYLYLSIYLYIYRADCMHTRSGTAFPSFELSSQAAHAWKPSVRRFGSAPHPWLMNRAAENSLSVRQKSHNRIDGHDVGY